MDAFATTAQYDARFPGRTASDTVLEECLDDATRAICAALDRRGIDYLDPSDEFADRLMATCRAVANRIMPSGADVPVGVTQMSTTAGPYSQTMSYTPSYGLPRLIASDYEMLGISSGYICSIDPKIGGTDD